MRSLLQRAATLFSPRSGNPAAPTPASMDARLAKLVARRRAAAVAKALDSLSDNRPEICSQPLYDSSVYHSADLEIETPILPDEPEEDGA